MLPAAKTGPLGTSPLEGMGSIHIETKIPHAMDEVKEEKNMFFIGN